jgi:hypothetical protein
MQTPGLSIERGREKGEIWPSCTAPSVHQLLLKKLQVGK